MNPTDCHCPDLPNQGIFLEVAEINWKKMNDKLCDKKTSFIVVSLEEWLLFILL